MLALKMLLLISGMLAAFSGFNKAVDGSDWEGGTTSPSGNRGCAVCVCGIVATLASLVWMAV